MPENALIYAYPKLSDRTTELNYIAVGELITKRSESCARNSLVTLRGAQ